MGTHPIFESDFDCLTETMLSGLSGSSDYSLVSSSEPDLDSIECLADAIDSSDPNTNKCPVCLVSPYTYVKTKCNHNYCLTCVIKMWESENAHTEDEEDWAPILCPMRRELVTHLTWSPASSILPHEIHDYNRLYRNYSEASRRSLSNRPFLAATFIVYLLIFIQLAPFLSFRFPKLAIHPESPKSKVFGRL